jgi:hypothetical protein
VIIRQASEVDRLTAVRACNAERAMSKGDEFRQYAEEALRWAKQSKTEKEKLALIDLARTWTEAAASLDLAANELSPRPKHFSAERTQGSP